MKLLCNLNFEQKLNFIGDTTRTDKLHGRKNETIYVTNYGYWHASEEFIKECKIRNLNVEVVLL